MELLVTPNDLVYLQVSMRVDGSFILPMVQAKHLGVFLTFFTDTLEIIFVRKSC